MKQLWSLLFGRTAKNSFITVGANVFYGILVMVFFALASRSLGPEKFGLVSIPLAIYAISFDILSLGTNQSLIRFASVYFGKNQDKVAFQFAKTIFNLRLLQSLFLIISAVFVGKFIAINIYGMSSLLAPLVISIAAASGILFSDFFIIFLQAYEKFARSAATLLSTAFFKLILIIPLILSQTTTVLSITTIFVITPIFAALVGFALTPKEFLKAKTSKKVTSELFHFSKWMALWGVTASLAGRIDILFLGKFASAYETGIYSAASRLVLGFIIIGSSFAAVLVPKLSRVVDSKTELIRQFKLIWKVVVLLVIGIIFSALISPWIIPLIFGNSFVQSVLVFQSLSVAAIFFMLSIPSNTTLLALGHSKFIGSLSLIQLIIVTALSITLIPQLGAQGAAIALILAYALVFALSTTYAFKKLHS